MADQIRGLIKEKERILYGNFNLITDSMVITIFRHRHLVNQNL